MAEEERESERDGMNGSRGVRGAVWVLAGCKEGREEGVALAKFQRARRRV